VRLLWLGTYEADYPRGRVLRAGLRALGHEVVECHVPVWERTRHKAGGFLALGPLAVTGGRAGVAWTRLRARERDVGPVDAVVAGYPAQADVLGASAAARRRGVPLVVDLMIAMSDTLGGDRGRVGALGTRGLLALDRLTAHRGDVVIADTAANAAWMARELRVPAGRLAVVPVGAETDLFRPSPPPAGPPTALFVGKLAPLHGVGVVLAAARRPGVPPVRIVGDGQLGPWLRGELARDLPPGLVHEPWIPYAQLPAAVAAAHICLGVFGGSDKAARVMPNKVWQAMAAGRPVVTADTPGAREVLTDGRDALLVSPGDPVALAAALARLAADAALRARLGEAARRRFEACGTPVAVAARLVDALAAAPRRAPAPPAVPA